jgi:hypothetical protein
LISDASEDDAEALRRTEMCPRVAFPALLG